MSDLRQKAARYLHQVVIPPRSVLDSRTRRGFMTFFWRSTASIIAQTRPFFLTTVQDFVVRYQTGSYVLAGRSSSLKSNSLTANGLGGNYAVFTYPYSVIWPHQASQYTQLKSAAPSTPAY